MRVLISGTTGFLGSFLKDFYLSHGWAVRELRRKQFSNNAADDVFISSLDREPKPDFFEGVDAFVHCAYDFSAFGWEEIQRVNVDGSVKLLQAALKSGIKKIIFVSSMSSFENCKSLYGRSKLEVEKEAIKIGVVILRPGFIFGPHAKGLFGNLVNLVRKIPIIPVVGWNDGHLFLTHIDDLANLIFNITTKQVSVPLNPLSVANPIPVQFKIILETIADAFGKKRIFIPIPNFFAYFPLKCIEFFGLRPRLRSDSLVGLFYPVKNPDFSWLETSGIKFRKFGPEHIR